MSDPDNYEKLQEKLERLTERVHFLQNLAWVLGGLAVALGLGGAGLWTSLADLRKAADGLKTEVEGYRTQAQQQAQTINVKIQETLQPALANALASISKGQDTATKAVASKEAEARSALAKQEEASIAAVSNQVLVGNNCMVVAAVQMCWGTAKLDRSKPNPHVAEFDFNFGKPFAEQPSITGSPSASGSGHMLAVYQWNATNTKYAGAVGNLHLGKPLDTNLYMSYVAIGKPVSK